MSTTGKKIIKNTNIWRLNNILLNNQQITEEIKKEIKICIETNENENTRTQNLWDSVKTVLSLENPRDGGAWWAAIYGVAQSWTRLKQLSSSSSKGKVHSNTSLPQVTEDKSNK